MARVKKGTWVDRSHLADWLVERLEFARDGDRVDREEANVVPSGLPPGTYSSLANTLTLQPEEPRTLISVSVIVLSVLSSPRLPLRLLLPIVKIAIRATTSSGRTQERRQKRKQRAPSASISVTPLTARLRSFPRVKTVPLLLHLFPVRMTRLMLRERLLIMLMRRIPVGILCRGLRRFLLRRSTPMLS